MNKAKKIQKKTWYGLNATVIIGPGFIHTSGWGVFLIPHPPIANWLLRLGLTEKNRETLTIIHEFEHLQSALFVLLYAVLLFVLAFSMTHVGLAEIIFILIGSHAAWEIISEILTYYNDSRLYRRCYEKISLFPRIAFWFIASATAITAWLIGLL
ncbi:MAG: hypothetical protein E4G71_04320 [Candidatus Atribacteria bacterium]|nr:MAG: hypothetical protein E4G71_04320 [Candidatus Atribacteria bacterium]